MVNGTTACAPARSLSQYEVFKLFLLESFGEQQLYLESTWCQLVAGGQCDVQAVYDRAGVAHYMAKQLTRRGYNKTYILSTEFHNHDM
jgi:hypothetical protein